jgi:phosphatidylserine/phosphatidylglycerophosphate/cardiolipin synthase-like enzyme
MKTTPAILCGLLLSAAFAAHADDGEMDLQEKLLVTSLNEINMTTATVMGVFEYCMKQDPGFSLRSLDSLESWKSRNMAVVALSPRMREEALVIAEREGMTRAEAETVLDDAAAAVAATFPSLLEADPDISRRVQVCDVYAGKIREGELDIAADDDMQRRYLQSRIDAAQR